MPLFDILEKYIDQLRDLRIDGTESVSGINFAEAAFIIQVTEYVLYICLVQYTVRILNVGNVIIPFLY